MAPGSLGWAHMSRRNSFFSFFQVALEVGRLNHYFLIWGLMLEAVAVAGPGGRASLLRAQGVEVAGVVEPVLLLGQAHQHSGLGHGHQRPLEVLGAGHEV